MKRILGEVRECKQRFVDFYAYVLGDRFAQVVIVFALILIGVALGLSFAFDMIAMLDAELGTYAAGRCE